MKIVKVLIMLASITYFVACSSTSADKTSSATMDTSEAGFEIETEEVKYKSGKKEFVGYIARPKVEGIRPAVLVVHEWWGQTDYPRKRAEMLAKMGYVAMAIDMYGGRKVLDHPKDAGKFAMKTMKSTRKVKNRFKAALKEIKSKSYVDKAKIAAIGYCFGGGIVLEMARRGANLKGVASFHGSLATKKVAKKGKVKAKVLVLNGAADEFVPEEQVTSFKKEMEEAGANFEFINYENAKHGFTNPDATENGKKFNIALAYDEKADNESWAKLSEFLKSIF